MRVLELVYSWPPETFIARHAGALAEHTSVDLILSARGSGSSASIQETSPSGYRVYSYPNFDHMGRLEKLRALVTNKAWLSRPTSWSWRDSTILGFFKRLQPDLVHFHVSSLAVLMAKYPIELGIPFTLSIRGSDIQVMPLACPDYVTKLCEVVSSSHGIHTVVNTFADELNRLCQSDFCCTTIFTCVPIPSRRHVVQDSAKVKFVSVGRLHWCKGYNDLIRAFAYLPKHYTLDLIGEGPERTFLQYLIHNLNLEDRVRLHGKMAYDEFQDLLYSATAYVQSSIAEGFSNALAEAMALGMPVFATPAGGTTEVISNGLNGLIITMANPQQMAKELKEAENTDRLRELGQEARLTAEGKFQSKIHATKFETFFQRAAKNTI